MQREGERKSLADSVLSTEPNTGFNVGLDLMPLSGNQKSET